MRLTGWPFLNPAIRVLANGYHAPVKRENVRYLSTKKQLLIVQVPSLYGEKEKKRVSLKCSGSKKVVLKSGVIFRTF